MGVVYLGIMIVNGSLACESVFGGRRIAFIHSCDIGTVSGSAEHSGGLLSPGTIVIVDASEHTQHLAHHYSHAASYTSREITMFRYLVFSLEHFPKKQAVLAIYYVPSVREMTLFVTLVSQFILDTSWVLF